jgi:hypothetical protein
MLVVYSVILVLVVALRDEKEGGRLSERREAQKEGNVLLA